MTKSVSFGVIGSIAYISPFALARTFSTLDHLTKGRAAWNVVTSFSQTVADAFGVRLQPHDNRHEIAEEYMNIIYQLLNGPWADDAVKFDEESSVAYEPSTIKKNEHDGKYLKMSAKHQMHPSPQGLREFTILFQDFLLRACLLDDEVYPSRQEPQNQVPPFPQSTLKQSTSADSFPLTQPPK